MELLEGRGIKVLAIDLTTNRRLDREGPGAGADAASVVVVNRGTWGERQRFTLAHELGHMVLQVGPGVDPEKAAHRFAGAFLMPAETLRAEVGAHRGSIGWSELFALKQLFGVSVQALALRCGELGIFDKTLLQRLYREFSRLGWRSPPYQEPQAMPGEEPRRFERLCLRALAEGVISEARAAELLGIAVRELSRRMEEPPDNGGGAAGR